MKQPHPQERQLVLADKRKLCKDYLRARRDRHVEGKRAWTMENELEAARSRLARQSLERRWSSRA